MGTLVAWSRRRELDRFPDRWLPIRLNSVQVFAAIRPSDPQSQQFACQPAERQDLTKSIWAETSLKIPEAEPCWVLSGFRQVDSHKEGIGRLESGPQKLRSSAALLVALLTQPNTHSHDP